MPAGHWDQASFRLLEESADSTCRSLSHLAWLTVAGTESVLPRWVHKQFPAASELVRKNKERSPAGARGAGTAPNHHDPERKLKTASSDSKKFRDTPTTTDGESLQERIVTEGMAGESILAIMPTGGGKSLGFQLPAIVHNERTGALTVVISPLQALMKDQVENLNKEDGVSNSGRHL